MRKFQSNTIGLFVLLLFVLASCSTRISTHGSYYKNEDYFFDTSKRNILVSLQNHDTWEARDNKILENELKGIMEEILTSHGYSVFAEREIGLKKIDNIHQNYDRIGEERNIGYHFILTIEPTESRTQELPITSGERMVKHWDYDSQSYKETPVTYVTGGGSSSYYVVIVAGALIDTNTKEQVWFGRTRTIANYSTGRRALITINIRKKPQIKNFYLNGTKELINKLVIDMM